MQQPSDRNGVPGTPRAGRGSVTSKAIQHLEELVLGGDLEPGDALPSEGVLASTLGVSRLAVREAFKVLEARGLVVVQHGRAPVVAHPNATALSAFFSAALRRDPGSLLELLEVRMALEVHTAALAAKNATSAGLNALQMAFEDMRRAEDSESLNVADVRFHAALAAASGNRMMSYLVEGMEGPLSHSRLESLQGHLARGQTMEDVVDQHLAILEAVKSRKAAAAASAMRAHLIQTRNDLRAALALPGASNSPGPRST